MTGVQTCALPISFYQNICLINGEPISWTFAHRARAGGAATQTAVFRVANSAGTVIQTLATQNSTTANQVWNVNTGTATYTGASGMQRVQFTTTNTGTQILASPFPITDLPFGLNLSFDSSSIDPGATTTHTINAFGGSGSPFHLLPGLPDPCNGATGSGDLRDTGSVTIGAGSGGGAFCGVTPATLPVRVFDFTMPPPT